MHIRVCVGYAQLDGNDLLNQLQDEEGTHLQNCYNQNGYKQSSECVAISAWYVFQKIALRTIDQLAQHETDMLKHISPSYRTMPVCHPCTRLPFVSAPRLLPRHRRRSHGRNNTKGINDHDSLYNSCMCSRLNCHRSNKDSNGLTASGDLGRCIHRRNCLVIKSLCLR